MIRLVSHAITVLTLLTIASGCSAEPVTFNAWMGVAEVETGLEFRFSAGAVKLDPTSSFGATVDLLSHDYYRLTPEQVTDLMSGLAEWIEHPHSNSVFSTSSGQVGLSFTGSAHGKVPVIVVSIYWWTNAGAGHHHGGPYMALTESDAPELLLALQTWKAGQSPRGLIYQVSR